LSRKSRWFRLRYLLFLWIVLLASGCSRIIEADLFVPVRLEGLPNGMILVESPVKGIEVRVRGPESRIKSIQGGRIGYAVDMTAARLGMQSIPINPVRIQLPMGVSIVGFSPETLAIELAREARKALGVTVALSGVPAPGREVRSAYPKPSTVIVRGPERIMETIETVATKAIDLTGAAESFQKEIAIEIPDGMLLDTPSQVITARIEIGEKIVIRQLKEVTIIGKGSPFQYRIVPATIDIEIKGPVHFLDELERKGGIKVFMDLVGLKPGVYPRRAALTLPPEITLVGTKPEIFTVTIYK